MSLNVIHFLVSSTNNPVHKRDGKMFNFDQIIHIFLLHLLIFCRIFHSYPISYQHPLFDDNFEDSSDWQPLRIGILLLPSNGITAINDLPDGINV